MTNIVNHRPSAALVAIAALASVLVVSTSSIIALAQTNSGIAPAAASLQTSAAGANDIFHDLSLCEGTRE
jgi:hypothetical protein